MTRISAFIAGLLFGIGLLLSGMANPAKVLGFLDAQIGFDDLLNRLGHALEGPSGSRLAETIRKQYPVALHDR